LHLLYILVHIIIVDFNDQLTYLILLFLLTYCMWCRLFRLRCVICLHELLPEESVIQIESAKIIFHRECFFCVTCRRTLSGGMPYALTPLGPKCHEHYIVATRYRSIREVKNKCQDDQQERNIFTNEERHKGDDDEITDEATGKN